MKPARSVLLLLALMLGSACMLGAGGQASAGPSGRMASPHDGSLAWAGPEAEADEDGEPAEPTWITHKVVPGETYEFIGERYGVSRDEIIRWNKKRLGKKQWLYAGRTLRIKPRRFAPPRERITYEVQKGDTWTKIGQRFNVSGKDVRGWNPKVPKAFRAGTTLTVYTNPKPPPPGAAAGGGRGGESAVAAKPEFKVRAGGIGTGKPNRGRLVNGVRLPDSDMVKILDQDKVWGTSHTIEHLQEAIAVFRAETGYSQPLTVSSISLKQGGRFRPHSSHQTGRDVDIRLPRKPGRTKGEAPSSVDWTLTWRLIEALVETGEVQYIFVSWSRQKYLRRAAQSAGAGRGELDELIQYPRKPNTNKGIVRHSPGHNVHLHVRFTCTPGNGRCVSY